MTELNKIIDQLSKLTLLEAAKLSKLLEDKWGCSPFQQKQNNTLENKITVKKEKKNKFILILKSPGEKKIAVIKAIKEITKLNLKEAKSIVDSAPTNIKENLSKEDAEKYKNILITAGAVIELK